MQLYPAIDLLDGRVVRLLHGGFDAVTDYGGDPVALAGDWIRQGADWLHVVDLAGARDGYQSQLAAIGALAATGIAVQSGGGIRSRKDLDRLFDAGVSRAVIGSLAVTDPDAVTGWLDTYGPERIVLAFDIRVTGGVAIPAIKGWTENATQTLEDILAVYATRRLRHALVTDIGRDGALSGPATDLYCDLAARYPEISWQASGGVSSREDLRTLQKTGVAGAITGRALLDGRFSVKEALACLRGA